MTTSSLWMRGDGPYYLSFRCLSLTGPVTNPTFGSPKTAHWFEFLGCCTSGSCGFARRNVARVGLRTATFKPFRMTFRRRLLAVV